MNVSLVRKDAISAARKVRKILGRGTDIIADKSTNSVFFCADSDKAQKIVEILKKGDGPRSSCIHLFKMKRVDARMIVRILSFTTKFRSCWMMNEMNDTRTSLLNRERIPSWCARTT